MRFRLGPLSLAEYAETDVAWWTELVTALSAYRQGQQNARGVKAEIARETAGMRSG